MVYLDVGGCRFRTSVETLTNQMQPSYFANLLGGVGGGRDIISIDRDPRHFGTILNFLRDGKCVLPPLVSALHELRIEADFYSLDALCREIDEQLATFMDPRVSIAQSLERIAHALERQ